MEMFATCSIHLVHIGKRSTALFLLKATEEELKMCRTNRGRVSHTLKMYLLNIFTVSKNLFFSFNWVQVFKLILCLWIFITKAPSVFFCKTWLAIILLSIFPNAHATATIFVRRSLHNVLQSGQCSTKLVQSPVDTLAVDHEVLPSNPHTRLRPNLVQDH